MAVRIRSLLVYGPLVVPLSSGRAVRLSPGETTGDLADVEVANNAKIDKLLDRHLIDVEPVAQQAPEPAEDSETGGDSEPASATSPTTAPSDGTLSPNR